MKTYSILKDTWDPASLNTKLFILVKKEFVDTLVKIILDNNCKTKFKSLLCDGTYFFTYDVKITKLGKFPDLEIFYVDNF